MDFFALLLSADVLLWVGVGEAVAAADGGRLLLAEADMVALADDEEEVLLVCEGALLGEGVGDNNAELEMLALLDGDDVALPVLELDRVLSGLRVLVPLRVPLELIEADDEAEDEEEDVGEGVLETLPVLDPLDVGEGDAVRLLVGVFEAVTGATATARKSLNLFAPAIYLHTPLLVLYEST